MRRRYRGAVLLAATCVVGASAQVLHMFGPTGASHVYAEAFQAEQERVAAFKAEHNKDYQVGDVFDLKGIDWRLPDNEEYSGTYLETLGWFGTLALKVSNLRWFSSLEDAGLGDWTGNLPTNEARYLFMDLEITNVDALSDNDELRDGGMIALCADVSSLSFRVDADEEGNYARDLVYGTLIYNSGEPEQDIINNHSVIAIPQGQTQTVTLGWAIESRAEDGSYPVDEPLVLYFGDAGSDGHCTVYLGVPEVG